MRILLTGASGFLGKALIPRLIARGDTIFALSRHPPEPAEDLIPLVGDVTKLNLGLNEIPNGIGAVYHLAAVHHLGKDKDGSIWDTNITGTRNVIDFCKANDISRLFFCSSAYTQGRNVYEKSKALGEQMVSISGIPKVVIFKPSIVMGTRENPFPGHFSQFVTLLVKVHGRAELMRRRMESALRLPVLEPVLRVVGNPEAHLNLVLVDEVAKGMARIRTKGTYWLTNPNPPTLRQLSHWIEEVVLFRLRIQQEDFYKTPIEMAVARRVLAFEPYLWGDSFPSHLKRHPPITRELIYDTVINSLSIDRK